MEHLHNLGMFFGRVFRFPQKQTPRDVSKSDAYLYMIRKILLWEQPKTTCVAFAILLISLWLVVQFEVKLYGIIFMSILIVLLGDYYLENKHILEDSDDAYAFTQQTIHYCNEIVMYLKMVRKKYRMQFCIVTCMLFLWLTVIARNVSGVTLAYFGLIGVFVCPFLISRLPSDYVHTFKEFLCMIRSSQGVLAESELIPYLSLKEQDNDLDSLVTDRTMDSITDSLISGITSMPSYMEAEKDPDDDDFDQRFHLTRESSTDTDSDKKSMNFESSHFNGDTSSSDDENQYRKGLKFSDVNNDLPSSSKSSEIFKNITSIGGNLIANVLQNKPKRKDSDSDFEIIDSDEVANS